MKILFNSDGTLANARIEFTREGTPTMANPRLSVTQADKLELKGVDCDVDIDAKA